MSRRSSSGGLGMARPGRSVPWLLVLCLAALLLAVAVAGCGEGDEESAAEPTEEEEFGEQLAEAEEEGSTVAAEPATFISLCANCHDRLDRELHWRQQRKLIFNHPAHFAAGIRCEACHEEFPHKPGRTIYVSVETCFVCHGTMHGEEGEIASTDCDTCHTEDIAQITPDHFEPDWLRVEGSEVAQHSQKAAEQRLYCKMCHEETYCRDCHQVDMPHPEDWLAAQHRTVAAEGSAGCEQCHALNYCNSCHHADFDQPADWQSQHRTVVADVGATACYECHQETFCAECHVRTGRERGVLGG